MESFESAFNDIKSQVVTLADAQLKNYSEQAVTETNTFLDSTKEKLKDWTEQLAEKKIDNDEFLWLLNSQKALGQMKILTQEASAKIKVDIFTNGVKKIVIDSLLKIVETAI